MARRCLRCRCLIERCDCERWERIYREKFEDPSYYLPREPATLQSSLSGIEPLDLSEAAIDRSQGTEPEKWRTDMDAQSKAAIARKQPQP